MYVFQGKLRVDFLMKDSNQVFGCDFYRESVYMSFPAIYYAITKENTIKKL